ncbi:MAG: hypothetical protein J5I90_12310 [Caldilineales bacterium]|nr:hypothetical protein [Caldilineales bacterium]
MNLRSLDELTDDFVVYRNLEPFDPRVPGLKHAWRQMGLDSPAILRKRDPLYSQAATWLLQRFQALHAPGVELAELLLIGDTLGNDGGAYQRLAEFTGWRGSAFIGSEALAHEPSVRWQGDLYIANRWICLADWLIELNRRGLALDERTIVVVDIDKTALGARGRNHKPIDGTRLEGMRQTVEEALGANADLDAFTAIYMELNQPEYHDLTGDNQDYLAYISIMTGAGVVDFGWLQQEHAAGRMNAFFDFLAKIQDRAGELRPSLMQIHRQVSRAAQDGDPTPFKDFRRNEYLAAVARMGQIDDETPVEIRRQEEICLTREVWDACRWLQDRGSLITSFSDKPDEACAPVAEMAAAGYQPIHRTPTHMLGEPLSIPPL